MTALQEPFRAPAQLRGLHNVNQVLTQNQLEYLLGSCDLRYLTTSLPSANVLAAPLGDYFERESAIPRLLTPDDLRALLADAIARNRDLRFGWWYGSHFVGTGELALLCGEELSFVDIAFSNHDGLFEEEAEPRSWSFPGHQGDVVLTHGAKGLSLTQTVSAPHILDLVRGYRVLLQLAQVRNDAQFGDSNPQYRHCFLSKPVQAIDDLVYGCHFNIEPAAALWRLGLVQRIPCISLVNDAWVTDVLYPHLWLEGKNPEEVRHQPWGFPIREEIAPVNTGG